MFGQFGINNSSDIFSITARTRLAGLGELIEDT